MSKTGHWIFLSIFRWNGKPVFELGRNLFWSDMEHSTVEDTSLHSPADVKQFTQCYYGLVVSLWTWNVMQDSFELSWHSLDAVPAMSALHMRSDCIHRTTPAAPGVWYLSEWTLLSIKQIFISTKLISTPGDELCAAHLEVLARVQFFGSKALQRKVAYFQERPSANWTLVKGDSAGTAQVVPVVAKHDGWRHVLHADWTFQFLQKPKMEILCYVVVHFGLWVGTHPSLEPVTLVN